MVDFEALKKPFPPESTSWRLGRVNGNKGIALAFVDARDVMERFDEACGPENWQNRYSHADAGKTICEIGIKCGSEWVWKADGAGDTDYEADKGALSDAFKRAAVRWQVGRYLYNIKAPWITVDITDPKRPQIPGHELERLMALLPGAEGGTVVSPLTGQAKTPGKFWSNKSLNILQKLPAEFKDGHGDPVWGNPDTIVWLTDNLPKMIDKAPSRIALTALQADNMFWLVNNLPEPDRDQIMSLFSIRASQFDGVKK